MLKTSPCWVPAASPAPRDWTWRSFATTAGRDLCPARPLPPQRWPVVAGHCVWHQRGLPAAQLDHRPVHRASQRARRRLHAQIRGQGGKRQGLSADTPSWPTMPSTRPARLRAPPAPPAPERAVGPSMTETRSTCPYCGVGCGVIIESKGKPDHRRAGRPGPPGQLWSPVHQGLDPGT